MRFPGRTSGRKAQSRFGPSRPTAELWGRFRSQVQIPLYRFNVSPTLPVQRATVSAAVLNESGRTPFAHAFIAKMKSGHTGMFERDGTSRLPITEFMGPSAAQMAGNSVVVEQVEEKAQEVVNKRLEHEITRILNGYGG